jgi:hypothetical protein
VKTRNSVKLFLLASLIVIVPTTMWADVVNGGFETNSGTGFPNTPASPWVITNPNPGAGQDATGVCTTSTCGPGPGPILYGPHTGNSYFYGGAWAGSTPPPNVAPGTVSQTGTVATVETLTLSFWIAQPLAGLPLTGANYWFVTWDGVIIDGAVDASPSAYTHVSHTVTSVVGANTVRFLFYDDAAPGAVSGYELDDVSITPVVGTTGFSVPEPNSVVLLMTMLLGVAALVGVFRKKLA